MFQYQIMKDETQIGVLFFHFSDALQAFVDIVARGDGNFHLNEFRDSVFVRCIISRKKVHGGHVYETRTHVNLLPLLQRDVQPVKSFCSLSVKETLIKERGLTAEQAEERILEASLVFCEWLRGEGTISCVDDIIEEILTLEPEQIKGCVLR